jgi:hypothetical protein
MQVPQQQSFLRSCYIAPKTFYAVPHVLGVDICFFGCRWHNLLNWVIKDKFLAMLGIIGRDYER